MAEQIGLQISGAVANSLLLEKHLEARKNNALLARENEVLASITQTMGASLNTAEVFPRFAEEAQKLIPADRIDFVRVDLEAGTLHSQESYGIDTGVPHRPLKGSVLEAVASGGQGVLLTPESEQELEKRFPRAIRAYRIGFSSMIFVPLVVEGSALGMIAFASREELFYDEHHLELAERIGAHIAGALANAQLYSERQRAEDDLSVLFEAVAHPIVVADRSGSIRRANSRAYIEFGHADGDLIGKPIEVLIAASHVQHHQQRRGTWFSNPVRRPMGDDQLLYARRKDGSEFPVDVWLTPVIMGDETWSMAGVRDITEEVRAREALEEREAEYKKLSEENAAMAEIGRVIGSSPDIEEIYEIFGERVRHLIPFDKIDIVSVDREREELRVEYVYGLPEKAATGHSGYTRPLIDSIAEEILRRGRGVLSVPRDRAEVLREFPASVDSFDRGRMSIIAVPLFARGKAIGMLVVSTASRQAYTAEELRLLERVGAQISGAVANSQLSADICRPRRRCVRASGGSETCSRKRQSRTFRLTGMV